MALALSPVAQNASAGDPHGTGSYTTASFTPSNNSLLIVAVSAQGVAFVGDIGGTLTISDSEGLTWTRRVFATQGTSFGSGIAIFTAPVTTGASMTITVDCDTKEIQNYFVDIYEATGHDGTTPTGATATGTALNQNASFNITLSGSPTSTSYVIAAVHAGNGGSTWAITEGSGWTEDFTHGTTSGPAHNFSEAQAQSILDLGSTTVPWANITQSGNMSAVALEILEAGGDATANVTGVSGTGAVGTVTATGETVASVTGVAATGAAGTVAATGAAVVSIDGVEAVGGVGSVTADDGNVSARPRGGWVPVESDANARRRRKREEEERQAERDLERLLNRVWSGTSTAPEAVKAAAQQVASAPAEAQPALVAPVVAALEAGSGRERDLGRKIAKAAVALAEAVNDDDEAMQVIGAIAEAWEAEENRLIDDLMESLSTAMERLAELQSRYAA